MGPATPRTPTPRSSRNASIDPFAPPEASAPEQLLELADADADVARRARKLSSAPPAAEQAGAARDAAARPDAGAGRRLSLSPQLDVASSSAGPAASPDAAGASARSPAAMPAAPPAPAVWPGASGTAPRPNGWSAVPGLGSSRSRFVVGVLLAVVLGFVPANLVASWRERSAYAAIDDKVAAAQSAADAPDSYAALDAFRASQLEAKRGARRTIAMTAMLIWAAVGGAVAYGWFRRMPWARGDQRG
jgi:hypothetical protein